MWRRLFVAFVVLAAVTSVPTAHATAEWSTEPRGITVLDADSGKVRWTRAAPEGVTFQHGKAGNGIVVATERTCAEYETGAEPAPVVRVFGEDGGSPRWHTVADGVLTRSRRSDPSVEVGVGASGVVVLVDQGTSGRGAATLSGAQRWSGTAATYVGGVSDDLVFWSSGGSSPLRATARRTGQEVFEFPRTPDPSWTSTYEVVAADKRNVLVANGGYTGRRGSEPEGPTTFFVLDATTGDESARFVSEDPRLRFSGVAMGHGVLAYSERGDIVARSLDDGSRAWHRSFQGQQPRVVASTDDLVIVGTDHGGLRALDLRTGARRWKLDDALVRAFDDETIIVIGTSGTDRGLRAVDTGSGKVRWSRGLPSSMPGNVSQVSFAVHDDTVVLTDACDLG